MGKIELDHTGSGSGVTLSSDGTDLLLDGTAIGGAGGGDLLAANNLSDVANAGTARNNLGLGTAATTAASAYATAAQGTTADEALPRAGGAMTGAITTNSTFDGRDVAVDGAKLDGIEAGATADQTDAEIRAAVEAATDSNVFTDADHTKLNGIATGATAYGDSDVDTHLNTSTASASEVLSWTGSDYDWVAQSGGGGGADLYSANESSPSAQPSATGGNAIAIGDSVTAAGADGVAIGLQAFARAQSALGLFGDAQAIESICIGKLSAVTADGAVQLGRNGYATAVDAVSLGRSRASGVDSFAAVIDNNASSYGSIGANSIAIGKQAKAASTDSIAIGNKATATSAESLVLSISTNYSSEATARRAVAIGYRALSSIRGKMAFAGHGFSANGDAQSGKIVLVSDTTDATPEPLTSNNNQAGLSDNQVLLPSNSAFAFHGTIVARESAASGTDCAAWKVEGLIRREGLANTTVLVNSATTVLDNTPSWGMALSADTTNGGLKIEVTGAAATNIRWVGTIHTSEVTYA